MRTIVKRTEPTSLTTHRRQAHADYDNYSDKDGLRRSLVDEQRGICCYCMCRIQADERHMKIAHWHSRAKHPADELDYGNLLAACLGGHGNPYARQHCDTYQQENDISRNPANSAHAVEGMVQFESDGSIHSNDPIFDAELCDVLNLNFDFLKSNRKAILDAFKTAIAKRGPLTRITLEKWLAEWHGDPPHGGELRPYCQVVVYWLRKRLARL